MPGGSDAKRAQQTGYGGDNSGRAPLVRQNIERDDSLTVGVPISIDGDYRISITASGSGTFQLLLGEEVLGKDVLTGRITLPANHGSEKPVFLGTRLIVHSVQPITIKLTSTGEHVFELWNVIFERVD